MAKKGSQEWRNNISRNMTKMTDQVLQKLREAFGVLANIEEACYYAQISIQTYYNWKEKYPELFEEIEGIKNNPKLAAKRTIINNLNGVDTAKWLLEKRDADFKPTTKHEVETKDMTERKPLTPEEALAIEAYNKVLHDETIKKMLAEKHESEKK